MFKFVANLMRINNECVSTEDRGIIYIFRTGTIIELQ